MPWFERMDVRCPSCGYDVAQTLEDGFPICPECGGPISLEQCARTARTIQPRSRRLIYAAWSLLPLSITIAIMLRRPAIAVLCLPVTLGAIYVSWCWIESWLEGPGAWLRALSSTAATALVLLLFTALGGFVVAALMAI